jgi:hypothetical protein
MATKTTYVCDCCFRETDSNLGWAKITVNGSADGKQLMPDVDRDLCEICRSPLQTAIQHVKKTAREKRNAEDAR